MIYDKVYMSYTNLHNRTSEMSVVSDIRTPNMYVGTLTYVKLKLTNNYPSITNISFLSISLSCNFLQNSTKAERIPFVSDGAVNFP